MKNGKAENLGILTMIRGINVPRFVVLFPGMSEEEQTEVIRGFLNNHRGATVAVRSSATQEDSVDASFAGMYVTKLSVPANLRDIRVAIEAVRTSGVEKGDVVSHYAAHRNIELSDTSISVIVQEMVEADMSGVVFSHSLSKTDGYYAISVSDGLGEKIVGGASNGTLIRIARGVKSRSLKEKWLKKLIVTMRAIEQRFQSTSLDVEFALKNGALFILQCRPITACTVEMDKAQEKQLFKRIKSVNATVTSRFHGDVLGDMIDINPVELLGAAPTPLDISIFKYLFADHIVERVRRDMGYDPLGIGLLEVVAGKPYASMRATAFSFRPLGISNRIYERMVRVYRNTLVKTPALQSRVEFDLYAMSCGEKLERVMQEAQLNDDEKSVVREAFLRIDTVFSQVSTTLAETFDAVATNYKQGTESVRDASLRTILEHVAHGTEMFVRVARLAFYWKNRFEELHPQENLNSLIGGHIRSVNGELQSDLVACRNGMITREEIVEWYGHLRPGQLSVFGESYADDPNTYLFAQMEQAEVARAEKWTHAFEGKVEFEHIITFMQARERMKFLFSQSLHLFATKLKHHLAQRGISECEVSRVSWDELCECLDGSTAFRAICTEDELPVLLPNVIIPGLTDLRVITYSEAMPSYITNSVVKAPVRGLEHLGVKADVNGALVLLPNADPGYDFLFHSGVVGIITKVGGPASHMCIRAIELQMPACIGCGESVYQKLASAQAAILDCNSQQIIILN